MGKKGWGKKEKRRKGEKEKRRKEENEMFQKGKIRFFSVRLCNDCVRIWMVSSLAGVIWLGGLGLRVWITHVSEYKQRQQIEKKEMKVKVE